jgi:hypothetical protein
VSTALDEAEEQGKMVVDLEDKFDTEREKLKEEISELRVMRLLLMK